MNKQRIIRGLVGGVIAKLLLLSFWVWFHLTGWSLQGKVPVGDFNLVSSETVAMFGSYWPAAVVEFLCIFALGASIGIGSAPFAEDRRTLLKETLIHFIVTGALVLLNLWVQRWLTLSIFFLAVYVRAYLLLWLARWIVRTLRMKRIRNKEVSP